MSTLAPTNHVLTSGTNGAMSWTNLLTVNSVNYSSLVGSTISTNSITVNNLQASTIQYSTINLSALSTINMSTIGIGATSGQYQLDIRGTAYVSSLAAPVDLISQGLRLLPSAANSAMITACLTKMARRVTPVATALPFWASGMTYGTVVMSPAPGLAANRIAYSGGVLLPDGRVVLVPFDSDSVGIFNPALSGTAAYTTVTATGYGKQQSLHRGGILLPDGRVLFLPGGLFLGFFNPATNSYYLENSINISNNNYNAYWGGVLLPDGRVLLVPNAITNICIYTPSTNTVTYITGLPGGGAYGSGVLLPDGRVVLVPGTGSTIGIVDPTGNNGLGSYSTWPGATMPGGFNGGYRGGVLLPDGRVVFVPHSATTVGIFNPALSGAAAYTTVAGPTTANQAYRCGVLLPDGRVLFIPYNGVEIGIFNPATNLYTTMPNTGVGLAIYEGGVLLPDGRVLLVPSFSSSIGIVSTNTPAPKEFCLHPFFNKF